jgi:ABC-2 type transport system permease protein
MRAILIDHVFRADLMIEALAINAVYLTIACIAFMALLNSARRVGSLMAVGE